MFWLVGRSWVLVSVRRPGGSLEAEWWAVSVAQTAGICFLVISSSHSQTAYHLTQRDL
jgi:hypothetical protein